MVCYVIICSILNHILDFSYSGERIYFGFIEERYDISRYDSVLFCAYLYASMRISVGMRFSWFTEVLYDEFHLPTGVAVGMWR